MNTRQQLLTYEDKLRKAKKLVPLASVNWTAYIPKEAGVYVLWKGNVPSYVGETSSLQLRMRDLARPINHSFTKKIAKELGLPANATKKIAQAISSSFKLSFVTVEFGRAEIEEFLILRWRNTLINKPAKRLEHSPQYRWVAELATREKSA